jgi:8-oxo-dGTP pyrophosphatase MutT (NUDIX family)
MSQPPSDRIGSHPVSSTVLDFSGQVWNVVTDTVTLPSGEQVRRDIVRHPSAVAVLALDDADRVLVVHQYRHAVGATLWELPAGLLDVASEDVQVAARRELWEETHHEGARWWVLADFFTSPGFCDEALRIYLVRDVRLAAGEQHDRHGEERDMPVEWVPLDVLRDQILAGDLHNPVLLVGVLAACASRADGWRTLRPPDAPWPLGPRQLRDRQA